MEEQNNINNIYEEETGNSSKKNWIILGVVVLLFAVSSFAMFHFMSPNGNDLPPVVIDPTPDDDDEEKIYLGVLPLQNPTVMLDRFGRLETYLNEYTNLNIEMKFYPVEGELGGFSAVVQDFIDGEVGFVFLAPVTTIQAYGNIGDDMEVIACGERYTGSPTYQGDLVVLENSPYQSVWDLQGKTVAGTSMSSTSGGLMPLGMLIEEGIDDSTFFAGGGLDYVGSHDKAVDAVLRGQAEGAFVNEQTMDKYLDDGQEIRSIWRHDPVPEFPFSANKNVVSAEQIEEFRQALLNSYEVDSLIHERVDSAYNRFVAVDINDYLPVKDAIDAVHGQIFYDLSRWGKEDIDDEELEEDMELEE